MKRYFFAGLATILPLIVTYVIIKYFVNFLTAPFIDFTQYLIYNSTPRYPMFLLIETPVILLILSQLMVLTMLFFSIVMIGFLGKMLIVKGIFRIFDKLIHKIPLVNNVYKGVQDMMYTFFKDKRPDFSKPVLIPFPNLSTRAIGFITKEKVSLPGKDLAVIYVPGSPTPLFGVLLLMPIENTSVINQPPQETVKFLISCGVVNSGHGEFSLDEG